MNKHKIMYERLEPKGKPHLLVKNSIDFILRNVTFLLFENRKPATLKHLRIAGK